MSTPNNFDVVNKGGYVDVLPHPTVALNAEVLCGIVERVKTELNLTQGISVGDDSQSREPTHRLGIRLHGGSAETAARVREMDLFPVLKADDLDVVEFRFVHDGKAYVDPRLTLRVSDFVSCAHALRAQFGRHSGFELRRGQLHYGTRSSCDDLNRKMTDFCQPLYQAVGKMTGQNYEGHTWLRLSGPFELLSLSRLTEMENVLLDPQPILHQYSYASSDVVVALNAGTVETAEDVQRFYEVAANVSLTLGIHPAAEDFAFTHNKHVWTTLQPSPRSSR